MNSSPIPPDHSALPESLRLLSLLWSLHAALTRTSHDMDAKLGVTGPQRFLLRFVGLEPGITRVQLANVVSLDASDLQADLDDLVSNSLLTAQSEPSGYYLTGKGASINAVMNGTVERAVSKALDDASPYERTSFRRMLERVLRHLGSPQ
jgi:DNA-binding MarR family transcriptional regulator